MGISDRLSHYMDQVHEGVKTSSKSAMAIVLKVITGFVLGLTFALIGQEVFSYGALLFVFAMVTVGSLVYRVMANWTLVATLVFDLIVVLMALLLRMYVLMAP